MTYQTDRKDLAEVTKHLDGGDRCWVETYVIWREPEKIFFRKILLELHLEIDLTSKVKSPFIVPSSTIDHPIDREEPRPTGTTRAAGKTHRCA